MWPHRKCTHSNFRYTFNFIFLISFVTEYLNRPKRNTFFVPDLGPAPFLVPALVRHHEGSIDAHCNPRVGPVHCPPRRWSYSTHPRRLWCRNTQVYQHCHTSCKNTLQRRSTFRCEPSQFPLTLTAGQVLRMLMAGKKKSQMETHQRRRVQEASRRRRIQKASRRRRIRKASRRRRSRKYSNSV